MPRGGPASSEIVRTATRRIAAAALNANRADGSHSCAPALRGHEGDRPEQGEAVDRRDGEHLGGPLFLVDAAQPSQTRPLRVSGIFEGALNQTV